MSSWFDGKITWITGASSGIGEALAKGLDAPGRTLILSGRREQELRRVAAEIKQAGTIISVFDITDYTQTEAAVKDVLSRTEGRLDGLINNAGISQRALAMDSRFEVDERLVQVNFLSQVHLTKLLLPVLLQSSDGRLAVVSSVMGKFGTPFRSGYAASKHALHGYFDSLRAELHQTPLRVTIICPGFVRTPITLNALTGDGTPLNQMDTGTDNGLDPAYFAKKALHAIGTGKNEKVIAGKKEKFGVFMKRFFPALYAKLITRISVR